MQKNKIDFAKLQGKKLKIGVVVACWNYEITSSLAVGCLEALQKAGLQRKNVIVCEAPGSFELPLMSQQLFKKHKVDAVVVLGCLIKGETMHFEYIADATAHGLMRVGLDTGKPVVFGILTCLNEKQAKARSTGENNHGYGWGMTAVEMALQIKKK